MGSWDEDQMIKALDEKALFKELLPQLQRLAKMGGTSDSIIKKSEPLAALGLAAAMFSEKEEVALKARIEVLNRGSGKPVERSVNVFGDISRLNEQDIDSRIANILGSNGQSELLKLAAKKALTMPKAKRAKQSRKPRKSNPLAGSVIDVEPSGNS